MSVNPICTATATGEHVLPSAALRCPVHGPAMLAAAGIKAAPVPISMSLKPRERTDAAAANPVSGAASGEFELRGAAAQSPTIGVEALADLAHDEVASVRSQVARNPRTPSLALVLLSTDEEWLVRGQSSRNHSSGATPHR